MLYNQRRLAQFRARKRNSNRIAFKSLGGKFPFRKLGKIFLGFLPFIAIFILVWLIPRIIIISSINCESQFGPCSSVLSTKLSQVQKASYAKVKTDVNNILHNDFLVDKYNLRLKLPNTIVVYAVERKPQVSVVSQENTSKFAQVDENGLIISINDSTNLPILLINQNLEFKVGQKLEDRISFATQVLSQMYKLYSLKLAIVDSNGITIEMNDGVVVIFPLGGDQDVLFGSLNLILSRLNSTNSDSRMEQILKFKPSVIDLRFRNPVLK